MERAIKWEYQAGQKRYKTRTHRDTGKSLQKQATHLKREQLN